MTDDIRSKVVKLLGGDESRAPHEPRPARKKRAAVSISGRGNVVGVGEHVHIRHQVIERPSIEPGPDAISPAGARKIQNAVEQLVDVDQAAGQLGGERSKLFAKWYRAIKDRYEVPSYRAIPATKEADVLAWLVRAERVERECLDAAGQRRLAEIRAVRGAP